MLLPLLIILKIASVSTQINDCPVQPQDFLKIENTRFLIEPYGVPTNFDTLFTKCRYLGLEPAVIQDFQDLRNLQKAFDRLNISRRFGLGVRFDSIYKIEETGLEMTFKSFLNEDKGKGNCVALNKLNDYSKLRMQKFYCKENVHSLCQFKQNCKSIIKEQKMNTIGYVVGRKLLMSQEKKTFKDASLSCTSKKLKLLDLEMDKENLELMYDLLENHEINREKFWTSGRELLEDGFIWESTASSFDPNDFNLTQSIENKCLSISLPFASKIERFNLEMDNCGESLRYICYQDNFEVKIEKNLTRMLRQVEQKEEKLEKPVCNYELPKLNLTSPGFSTEDIIKLMQLNVKYELKNGYYKPKMEPKWIQDFIETITRITKSLCHNDQVSHGFLNIMSNLVQIYFGNLKNIKVNETFWKNNVEQLKACSDGRIESGFYETNREIYVRAELVDNLNGKLDLVVDTFWYMFQISMASCHGLLQSGAMEWLVDYFVRFKSDLLTLVYKRWTMLQSHDDYGIFMGDLDLSRAVYNLRVCSSGIFYHAGIGDRQLARPIDVDNELGLDDVVENLFTGHEYHYESYYSQ